MNYWKIALLLLACLTIIQAIQAQHKERYHLEPHQNANYSYPITQDSRITILQYRGSAHVAIKDSQGSLIAESKEAIFQYSLLPKKMESNLTVTISAVDDGVIGSLQIEPLHNFQLLPIGEERSIHISRGETRILQIHPRKMTKLIIERFDGTPMFINNRCKNYEKTACLDEMHRYQPQSMKKHIEIIDLEYCANCLLLIKITTKSSFAKMRFSIEANRTVFEQYPVLMVLKKDQSTIFQVYGHNQQGKIIFYDGYAELLSNVEASNFTNGLTYQSVTDLNNTQQTVPILLQMKGKANVSFFSIHSPQKASQVIQLWDGLPDSVFIEQNKTYVFKYESHSIGKGNIQLSSTSQFLSRLSIKFTEKQSKQHYLIRPKFLFNHSFASQNFQLDQSEHEIEIELHLVNGTGGYLNVSANVKQLITLPLDQEYSSILQHREFDDYIIQGVSGNVEIIITKCVDCSINVYVGDSQALATKNGSVDVRDNVYRAVHKVNNQQFYIKVETGNYAYYSIIVKRQSSQSAPKLLDDKVAYYITQGSNDSLLIEFSPPICNHTACENVTYYLLEGSELLHLASKVYCPENLFDFDQRTKDIAVEIIKPDPSNSILSHKREMKQRDYIGIVAQIGDIILPYKVINTAQVKFYKQMRWPFFYLAVFITSALFFSFILFMGLRRKNYYNSSGYVRVSAATSLEDIS